MMGTKPEFFLFRAEFVIVVARCFLFSRDISISNQSLYLGREVV